MPGRDEPRNDGSRPGVRAGSEVVMSRRDEISRRTFLTTLAAAGATAAFRPPTLAARPGPGPILTRAIPSSGEALPLVGLGSSITFNVGNDPAAKDVCAEVIKIFFAEGGRLIDSSPMYGSSQEVIGYGLARLGHPKQLFSADKVWINDGKKGPAQIQESERRWGVSKFDLLQVHNLMSWEDHLQTLFAMKKAGTLRYVGITTSHGRRHDELEKIMRSQPIDFVQLSYNAADREVEERLLPLAQERKIAVICNRPFQKGDLIQALRKTPLPSFSSEIGCSGWPQVLLKFVVSHPAVTCAIPATSNPAHMREDIAAAYGRLPDEAMRRRIVEAVGKA
jgi:diketogulonate reductase-like aldo/keto reductase